MRCKYCMNASSLDIGFTREPESDVIREYYRGSELIARVATRHGWRCNSCGKVMPLTSNPDCNVEYKQQAGLYWKRYHRERLERKKSLGKIKIVL